MSEAKKPKAVKAWAILEDGRIVYSQLRMTDIWENYVYNNPTGSPTPCADCRCKTVKYCLAKQGYRCIRVLISPLP